MTAVYAIGNREGRIAVHLDRDEALALASLYGPDDEQAWELLEAVRIVYPDTGERQQPRALTAEEWDQARTEGGLPGRPIEEAA